MGDGPIKKRFRSRSEHSLDVKGRLNFPSRFKEVLREYGSEVLMITNWGKHLRAYPVSEWEIVEDKLLNQGKQQPRFGSFVRLVISGVKECELDKQGRVLLPPSLRSEVNLEKEVVLTGMLDWVEIWSKDAWVAEHQATKDSFDDYAESLAELGIL